LFSFRNHGDFHEDVTNVIMNDLIALMRPKYIEVTGLFVPRGGIAIHPFANWANPDFGYADKAAARLFERMEKALAEEQ
ncbi:MAG TPA: NADPH-dependent 7-cyano-7-deazaguanine reductase QueF, partial [Eggerthellaceae bacterium]|nr:NADPH-dependent 7-cyano-7-deazaguanine reductase QueF [Eggerthellaceae bacterium]